MKKDIFFNLVARNWRTLLHLNLHFCYFQRYFNNVSFIFFDLWTFKNRNRKDLSKKNLKSFGVNFINILQAAFFVQKCFELLFDNGSAVLRETLTHTPPHPQKMDGKSHQKTKYDFEECGLQHLDKQHSAYGVWTKQLFVSLKRMFSKPNRVLPKVLAFGQTAFSLWCAH